MAAKKKISKKTPAKPAKVSKAAKAAPKVSAKSAAASNVDTLAAAGVIDPGELSATEKSTINGKLTASDVETLISVFDKLGGTTKGRVQVQLCF